MKHFRFYYDALTENVNYPARAAYLDGLVQKYEQSAGKVMLDLACGTGTMTEEMAERGYDMIGVDYSEGMLGQAMEKKIEKQLPIQYVCQDMRELELYGTVDAVICTLDSLNHLPSFEDVTTVFQRVWESTETGGVFVFDMNTLYKHRELLGNQVYVYETDAVYCVWENALCEDNCTVEITLDLFQLCADGRYRRTEEQITERAYAPEQVQAALETIGFHVLGIYHADTEKTTAFRQRTHGGCGEKGSINNGNSETCNCKRCISRGNCGRCHGYCRRDRKDSPDICGSYGGTGAVVHCGKYDGL